MNTVTRLLPRMSIATLLMLLVLLLCAALVVYPVVFIIAESLNVGEPGVFPPTEISLHNFAVMTEDVDILVNTLLVALAATVMAVVIGFVLAWILTRTNIPGRARLERLMELPYYMTPAGRRDGLGHPGRAEDRPAQPALARVRRARRICSTSIRRSASPG